MVVVWLGECEGALGKGSMKVHPEAPKQHMLEKQ